MTLLYLEQFYHDRKIERQLQSYVPSMHSLSHYLRPPPARHNCYCYEPALTPSPQFTLGPTLGVVHGCSVGLDKCVMTVTVSYRVISLP
jgi:hypothetical protein